jgi:hypothetical protein
VAVLLFALGGLRALGLIDESVYQTLLAMLGAGGIAAVRHAIEKIERLR